MEERLYTICFSKIYALGRHRERARKAIKYLRAFSARHMKTIEDKVVIGTDVNEYLWRNGIQRPPRRVRVKLMKDKDGTVMVALEEAAEKKEAKVSKEKKKEDKPKAEKKVKEAPKKEEKKAEVKKETPAPKADAVN
jgi:large subunit ribosomal protein L31e